MSNRQNAEHHIFNIELAKEVGIEPAILYQNIVHWINKNEANDKHFYKDRHWTYNSVKAFNKLFPYMTAYKISAGLKKLEDMGLIVSGSFNKSAYDRTKWYAIGDLKDVDSISRKPKMETLNNENGFEDFKEPIPNVNTDVNSNLNFYKKDNKKENQTSLESVKDEKKKEKKSSAQKKKKFGKKEMKEILLKHGANEQHIEDWFAVRDKKRAVYTKTALNGVLNECKRNNFSIAEAIRISAENNWTGFKYAWYLNLIGRTQQPKTDYSTFRHNRKTT